MDYAKVIYCLTTGIKSAESMSWDAGRMIRSSVLREIVSTICGRNHSVEPLWKKLRQPYTDEDSFFGDYTTVNEKEGCEAAERQRRIDAENRASEIREASSVRQTAFTKPRNSWLEKLGIFILMALCVGGYKACKSRKRMQHEQATQRIQMKHEQRQQMRESLKGVIYRAKPAGTDNSSEGEDSFTTDLAQTHAYGLLCMSLWCASENHT